MKFKKTNSSMRAYGINIYSPDDDDEDEGYCRLSIMFRNTCWDAKFKSNIIKQRKIIDKEYNPDTLNRTQYGIIYIADDRFVNIHYGISIGHSKVDKQAGWFVPWLSWCFRRYTIYDLNGDVYRTELGHINWKDRHKLNYESIEDGCERCYFLFKDYLDTEIYAECYISEREWSRGEGWFKWLEYFSKPKINRLIELNFSEGMHTLNISDNRESSGTIGHAVNIDEGESSVSAFKKYCDQYSMTFIREISKADASAIEDIKKLEKT